LVVDDHASADAGADGDVYQVAMPYPGTVPPFAKCCQVGIISNRCRNMKMILDQFSKR
jgi:hypothetical protein